MVIITLGFVALFFALDVRTGVELWLNALRFFPRALVWLCMACCKRLCVGVGDRRGLVTLRRAAQPPKVFF
jgi:hypothetical protein